jgi:MFS family permease
MAKKITETTRKVLVRGSAPAKKAAEKKIIVEKTPKQAEIKKVVIRKKPKKLESREQLVNKSLRYSIIEGSFTSVSSSIVNSFLVPFALFLKATSAQIGLLSSMQDLSSTFGQLPGAVLTEKYSRKSIWLFVQLVGRIALWIPVMLLPFLNLDAPIYWLIILVSLTAFLVGTRSPAWTSLMGDLVPQNIRGRYFGRRNMILASAGILATLVAGQVLTVYGFPAIFALLILFSALGIPFFMKMYEPTAKRIFHYKHRFALKPAHWRSALRANRPMVIFALYMVLTNFFVEMVAPFYSVYMLRDLGINYATFSILIVLGALARIISFRYWGRLSDRYGSRKIFVVCAIVGIFVPFFWMWVQNPMAAALVMIFDGLIWSGLDLVTFNYLLDVTPCDRRPQYVANYNFFIGLGAFFGALTGGLLATKFEGTTFFILQGLQIVFMISFVLRLLGLSLLPKISEIHVSHIGVPVRYVFWQAMAVEPMKGVQQAIHYTFRYPYEIEKEFRREVRRIRYKVKMARG